MTEPTEQRIEVVARSLAVLRFNTHYGEGELDPQKLQKAADAYWKRYVSEARAALTADAPFAASEYARGLRVAREIVLDMGDGKRQRWINRSDTLAAIDARLSALKDGGT